MSIVKINCLTVPAEEREELERRFSTRTGDVENSDGFEWFELLRPVEGTDDYLVYTRWRSEEDFRTWLSARKERKEAAHRASGEGGPRAVAEASTLWSFEVVQQASPKS